MKKPATLNDFAALINGMDHRERLTFSLNQETERRYADQYACSLEVYCTEVDEQKKLDGRDPRSVLVQVVDARGKKIAGKARLMRLISKSYLKTYYEMIAQDGFSYSQSKLSNTIKN